MATRSSCESDGPEIDDHLALGLFPGELMLLRGVEASMAADGRGHGSRLGVSEWIVGLGEARTEILVRSSRGVRDPTARELFARPISGRIEPDPELRSDSISGDPPRVVASSDGFAPFTSMGSIPSGMKSGTRYSVPFVVVWMCDVS